VNTNRITNPSQLIRHAFSALTALCFGGLAVVSYAGTLNPLLQIATTLNSNDDWTSLSRKDSNPNMLYFVTSHWKPAGSPGVYNDHPIGVLFTGKDWAIFNEDHTPIPRGAAFDVVGMPSEADACLHTATASNIQGNFTLIDNPYINGVPTALVWVTPNFNPGGKGYAFNNHNIGVFYDTTRKRWAVFNEDYSPMRPGASFNITYGRDAFFPDYYVHHAMTGNTVGNSTFLDDPRINGSDGHQLMVTHNWNPGGVGKVYNNHPIGVWYDTTRKRWAVFNEDRTPIPHGASFNVWVIN